MRPLNYRYQRYLVTCVSCSGKTSTKYASQNGGKCKSCVTGTDQTHTEQEFREQIV
jgi:hypothetical protein